MSAIASLLAGIRGSPRVVPRYHVLGGNRRLLRDIAQCASDHDAATEGDPDQGEAAELTTMIAQSLLALQADRDSHGHLQDNHGDNPPTHVGGALFRRGKAGNFARPIRRPPSRTRISSPRTQRSER